MKGFYFIFSLIVVYHQILKMECIATIKKNILIKFNFSLIYFKVTKGYKEIKDLYF